jgi:hypothetical protein
MAERLRVTLSGGREGYLETTGEARELQLLIVEGRLGETWLPLEGGEGLVRVDAIVHLKLEGRPEDAELEHERLEGERRELEGIPLVDDLHALERRGR